MHRVVILVINCCVFRLLWVVIVHVPPGERLTHGEAMQMKTICTPIKRADKGGTWTNYYLSISMCCNGGGFCIGGMEAV